MTTFVRICNLHDDSLYIFVGSLYRSIHLWSIRCWVVILDFDLGTDLFDKVVVQIEGIFRYDYFQKSIPAYDLLLDEST